MSYDDIEARLLASAAEHTTPKALYRYATGLRGLLPHLRAGHSASGQYDLEASDWASARLTRRRNSP